MDNQKFLDYRNKVVNNCAKVIVGKEAAIELVLICFVCGGHVLLEDLPGTGKTLLLRSFSRTIGGDFSRIQFTPDLLPSDLTGVNFYNQKTGDFEFRKGPLFANVVLADEINRATPRTQSSLLEAMEEHQVSVDGESLPLPEPYMVMATQNPIESYGTFPLPEAQTDRFFMRLALGYMTREQELTVISRKSSLDLVESLTRAVTDEETAYVRAHYVDATVSKDVAGYIMDVVQKTRSGNNFVAGASTRGAIALYKASQVYAAFRAREYVIPEDVRAVAPYVLCHRLSGGSGAAGSEDTRLYVRRLLEEVPVPTEEI